MKNRKILIEKAPGIFKYFQYEVKLYESIEFCKEWLLHRKWLGSNKVDFKLFDENLRYNEI